MTKVKENYKINKTLPKLTREKTKQLRRHWSKFNKNRFISKYSDKNIWIFSKFPDWYLAVSDFSIVNYFATMSVLWKLLKRGTFV